MPSGDSWCTSRANEGMRGAAPVHSRIFLARSVRGALPSAGVTCRVVESSREAVPFTTRTPRRAVSCSSSLAYTRATASATCRRTCAMSTLTSEAVTPKSAPLRAMWAIFAAFMRALLGTHPVHVQSPPILFFSISTTRTPSLAAKRAALSPPEPAPTTASVYVSEGTVPCPMMKPCTRDMLCSRVERTYAQADQFKVLFKVQTLCFRLGEYFVHARSNNCSKVHDLQVTRCDRTKLNACSPKIWKFVLRNNASWKMS
mmetsp:Transcript_28034/g.53368  ORF Transcript_28034/g.53368 Transcript_28034/m.53368 type:complete len:258 (+) Transcript_28034:1304-2077(+)